MTALEYKRIAALLAKETNSSLYCPLCGEELELKDVMDDTGPKPITCHGLDFTINIKPPEPKHQKKLATKEDES
jgi:hypothetical protein